MKLRVYLFRPSSWRTLIYKIIIRLKKVDFSNSTLQELNLSADYSKANNASGGPDLVKAVLSFNLPFTGHDSIIDIGCAKGSAIYSLSKLPFNEVAGLDISQNLIEIAQKNLSKLRVKNYQLFSMDAMSFAEYDSFNYIYMFNPVTKIVMRKIMLNISDSFDRCPREITILYLFPVCNDELIESGFVKINETTLYGLPFCCYNNKLMHSIRNHL